jgi:hypothetical protein
VSRVQLSFPPDEAVLLGPEDAHRLIDALWAVSTTVGAVATVGKIRHALVAGGDVVVGDAAEATAMQAALEHAGRLTPALERLLAVTEQSKPHLR